MAPPIHNLPSECRTPFDPGDFQRLDTTPDGSLSYGPGNEITPDALECFISRYLHTARQTRDIFALGTALWEVMRTRLQQLAGDNTLPALSSEIAYLLEHQFSHRLFFANGEVATQHEGASSVSDFSTMHEALNHRTHSIDGAGTAGVRLNLGEAWRLATSLMLLGSQRWGKQEITSSTASIAHEFDYQQLTALPALQIFSTDGAWATNINGWYTRSFNTPADSLLHDGAIQLDAKGDNISLGNYVLSLKGSFQYQDTEHEPPPAELSYLTRRATRLTGGGEVTFGTRRFGLVADSQYTSADTVQHTATSVMESYQGHLKSRMVLDEHTMCDIGLGGTWSAIRMTSSLFDTALAIDNGGFVTSALLTMNFANGISLTTAGDVSANRSDGTFVGWYPSWAAEMRFSYDRPQWDFSGSLRYTGQDIDLNEVQGQHAVTASLSAGARPSDHLSFSVFVNGGYTKTTGYWAGRDWSISANVSAAYQLPAWEHFAIQLSGFVAYFNTAYRQADTDGTIGNLAWQTKLSAVISY